MLQKNALDDYEKKGDGQGGLYLSHELFHVILYLLHKPLSQWILT